MSIEVIKQALEALEVANSCIDGYYLPKEKAWLPEIEQAITSLHQAIAEAEKQEPVVIDMTTMKLAESVGLIGPASRSDDLHAAIQRFHDLVCVNATVKAAQMAASAIQESAHPQPKREWVGLTVMEAVELDIATNHPREFAAAIEAKLKSKNGF